MAETEKYPHVTYFFGGGSEHRQAGEDWRLVDSPRDVPTYDRKPAMSAEAVADALSDGLGRQHGFALVNFANPDMVGHTGVIPAAVEAVETVDGCLGRVVEAIDRLDGVCLITADHGNAELMLNRDGSPNTAHTTNPVPLIVTREARGCATTGGFGHRADGLELLGLPLPAEMSGRSLLA